MSVPTILKEAEVSEEAGQPQQWQWRLAAFSCSTVRCSVLLGAYVCRTLGGCMPYSGGLFPAIIHHQNGIPVELSTDPRKTNETDGFCNFRQCQQASWESPTKFGAGIFFKLSYEVYNYGEGLVGKVAADYGHKYIYRDGSSTKEPHSFYSWSSSVDPLPRAWEPQFRSGIKTIALVAVREGVLQLGSLEKVAEDLNLVISIQRKFNYLHSIPGVFAVQRRFDTPPLPYNTMVVASSRPNLQFLPSPFTEVDHFESREYETKPGASQLVLGKRWCSQIMEKPSPSKAINLGWNGPRALASPAPLLPSVASGFGNVFSPAPPFNHHEALQSPVGTTLGEIRWGVNLELISSVKPEPRSEDLEESNVRAPSTSKSMSSAPTTFGTGAQWIIQ